jgi:Uri superfamily endonuclease
MLKSQLGTYALILQNNSTASIQVGRWREIEILPGYYIYVGTAFGPGGVRARVSRHLRPDKLKHWHIDYLHEFVTQLEAWISYEPERLEHQWAQVFYEMDGTTPIQGFGAATASVIRICFTHQ